ncbi:MAG: substrate-binding domain-containing protein [Leeuwenhoekiella sp.]
MINLRLGGVPEHFNLPIHLAIEDGLFEQRGIEVEWIEFPQGTGAMTKALRNDEIDIAIILTDGIIKDIANGNPSKIIQNYVSSPLIWGIHVAAKSSFTKLADLEHKRVAISRYGSGSHIMAYVLAKKNNWDTDKLEFVEVQTLQNAVKCLTNEEADYFMWEHFTTKPLVDSGVFRRVSDFPTPWSSFVIAAADKCISENAESLNTFLNTLNVVTEDFKRIPSIDKTLANRYEQKLEDVQKWLSLTRWSQAQITDDEVNFVQSSLQELKMIDESKNPGFYVAKI